MSIKNAITLLVFILILLGIMNVVSKKAKETLKATNAQIIDNQQKTIDSLENELFILQNEVGRYEIAIELLKEQDAIANQKLQNILNTQVE